MLQPFFLFMAMNFTEFKERYESQLMLGKVLQTICDYQLKTEAIELEKIAEKLCPFKQLDDAHWLTTPLTTEDAWDMFTKNNHAKR